MLWTKVRQPVSPPQNPRVGLMPSLAGSPSKSEHGVDSYLRVIRVCGMIGVLTRLGDGGRVDVVGSLCVPRIDVFRRNATRLLSTDECQLSHRCFQLRHCVRGAWLTGS